MTVQPFSWAYPRRGMHGNAATSSSSIQPAVKTIIDLSRECEQHIVRLYYLPTPGTNGFTTTHTLVFPLTDNDKYPAAASSTTATSTSLYKNITHEQGQGQGTTPTINKSDTRTRRIMHLTRSSESDRRVVYLARLRISTMVIATSSLPYLSQVVSLRLQGNQLTDLPLQIFRLPSLRELDVSQNWLTEISPLIGLLAPTLEELFLQSNRLQSLPQQLGQLKRLRLLDIADNHLGCIPVEVQRLVSESFSSERRSLWRLNESSLSLNNSNTNNNNHGGNDDIQPQTGDGPHNPTPQSPAEQHLGGHGGALNLTPNEDGGHDDDDYVQIRHGMKCWARGNRFWQVKMTRSPAAANLSSGAGSTPLSPISATTTMLLSGPAPSSTPISPTLRSSTTGRSSALTTSSGLDHGPGELTSSLSALSLSSTSSPPTSPGSHHRSERTRDVQPLFETHGLFDRHPSRQHYHAHAHEQRQHSHNQPHPEHLVDRRGYCKDSYTSCSWTLSLVDICSQIVGEKLHDDPHYFCHRSSCPVKKSNSSSRVANGTRSSLSPSPPRATISHREQSTATYNMESEDPMDGCTAMLIPDGMIEQLGLYHIPELRKAFHSRGADESVGGGSDHGDDYAGRTNIGSGSEHSDHVFGRSRTQSRPTLVDLPTPMELTLEEKEMECEYCSVCQKRLYFEGMRWKGVGVMDERIVPLEWAACSVQCRAKAERGERRDHHHQQQQHPHQSHYGVSFDFQGAPSRGDSGSTTGGSDYDGEEVITRTQVGGEGGFQNGVHTRVNQDGQIYSLSMSPTTMTTTTTTGEQLGNNGVTEGTLATTTAAVAGTAGAVARAVGESGGHRGGGVGNRHGTRRSNYRENVVYGLIKTSALRRRTRALSL